MTTPACTRKASAASETAAATTIRKTSSDINLSLETGLAHCVAIGLFAGFDGIVQGVLLPAQRVLALIHPFCGRLLYFVTALLQVLSALTGFIFQELGAFASFVLDQIASFLA